MRRSDAVSRLAEVSLEAARQGGALALSLLRRAAEPLQERRRTDTRNRQPPPSVPSQPPAPPPAPALAASRPQPPAPEPAHVDREAVVVAESADAGAADGAGAEIHVDEPWDGYGQLTAKDITAQLATADPATLAVVRLYESSHRNRRTVLAAIDRRLATADR